MGLQNGVISIVHVPRGVSIQATTNISDQYLRIMAEEAAHLPALWGGFEKFARIPAEEPIRISDFVPEHQIGGEPLLRAVRTARG